jgi:hypothetical protein
MSQETFDETMTFAKNYVPNLHTFHETSISEGKYTQKELDDCCEDITHDKELISSSEYDGYYLDDYCLLHSVRYTHRSKFKNDDNLNRLNLMVEAYIKDVLLDENISDVYWSSELFRAIAINKRRHAIEYFPLEVRNDIEFMTRLLKYQCNNKLKLSSNNFYRFIGKQPFNNYEFVQLAVSNNGLALQYASDELKNDENIVQLAVTNNGLALQYASNELKDNDDIAFIAVNSYVFAYNYMSNRLQNTDKYKELYNKNSKGKVDWSRLSGNPNSIDILEKAVDTIDWRSLSVNPNAIHLLENN